VNELTLADKDESEEVTLAFDASQGANLVQELESFPDVMQELLRRRTATPPRSAEEIAREMVPDAGWLQLGTDGVRLASDVSVPHARTIITRLIEQIRAECAAAAQSAQPSDLAGRTWAGRVRDDGSAVIYVGNVPVASLGAPEVQKLANEALARPSDLAGRIREMIQTKAGEWADAVSTPEPTASALNEVLRLLTHALGRARTGGDVAECIENLRDIAAVSPARGSTYAQAAEELETIVRECAQETKR
jgi:hypothetical protein